MSTVFRGLDPLKDWEYVTTNIQTVRTEDVRGLVACDADDQDKIFGVVLLDHFTSSSCQVHLAVTDFKRAQMREMVKQGLVYVFDEVKRLVLIAQTPSTNTKAINFAKRAGFESHTSIKDAVSENVDITVMRLTAERYRELQGVANGR